jgi:plastocyanin
MPSIAKILLCAGVAIALGGCGEDEQTPGSEKKAAPAASESSRGTTHDASTEPRSATIEIALTSTGRVPQVVPARPGQTIVFENEDDVSHRVESTDGPDFPSKTLAKGDTLEHTLRAEDAWVRYVCSIHPAKLGGNTNIIDE